ncbi:hypothetical protein Tco_1097258 [Tanacetum coccineum]
MVESENNIEDEIADVILEDLQIKYGKDDKGKGKVDDVDLQNKVERLEGDLARAKQAMDDVDLVDADDVDLVDTLDLENIIKKLEGDFSRLLKAKKAKESKEAELKVKKEVVQVSSDEGFSADEDVVCFNDVKYPLTDAEIRMFKETPITSRGPRRQLVSTSTRSRAPIAFTSSAQTASTSAPKVYMRIAMIGCVLSLFAPNASYALPPFSPTKKGSLSLSYIVSYVLYVDDVLVC